MDSDDAPELTDAFFKKADKYVDGKLVPREPEDDLTVVYLWARKEAEDEIKALRAENERLRGRVDQLRELDDLSRREIENLTQKVLLLERVGQRMSLGYDDLENRKEELREEVERLREALREIATDDEDYHHRGHEYRLIARAALGEDKALEERWDD